MNVFILTYFNGKEDLFGSASCVFNTLRKGFPTATINIFDNSVQPTEEIQKLATKCGCIYKKLDVVIEHHEFIEKIITCGLYEECIFVDPDVIFYDNIETELKRIGDYYWLAGFLNPPYYNDLIDANTVERIHTSLMYVKSCKELNRILSAYSFFDGFRPFVIKDTSRIDTFYDTCANLYHAIPKNRVYAFDEEILDCYTHLYLGSQIKTVAPFMSGGNGILTQHKKAKENPSSVKGLWRKQQEYFNSLKLKSVA